ncbi:MAG: hypothetical protein JO189_15240, partial [Deltaproteobacteria bacterium]|nr:hypothetical protein [Deltaproteobacteria bacterium]
PSKLSLSPADVGGLTERASPKLGEDNDYVYRELFGLTADELAVLKQEDVI